MRQYTPARDVAANTIAKYVRTRPSGVDQYTFDAPYGVYQLVAINDDGTVSSEIVFGIGRIMTAIVRVYEPDYITLEYATTITTKPPMGSLLFRGEDAVGDAIRYIEENLA